MKKKKGTHQQDIEKLLTCIDCGKAFANGCLLTMNIKSDHAENKCQGYNCDNDLLQGGI